MKIKQANIEDIDSIIRFQQAMAHETEGIELNGEILQKGVEAVLKDQHKGIYYVAEIGGQVVASLLTTYEWSDWRNGTVLWIQSVYVLPEYRRRGVYRSMYAHIKNLVTNSEELKGIRLYADKNNHPAHRTYENMGMNQDHYITFEWLK
jgi:GNAT superfamily N-acetyltransferase